MRINIQMFKKSIEYSTEALNIVKEYSIFMDKYFENESKREEHKEVWLAYNKMSNQLKEKAKKKGLM